MGWQKVAKILEDEKTGEVVGQAPTHTYSSSSYSFTGETAITRSIQSCGKKVYDSGACSGTDGMSVPDTPLLFLGTRAQHQMAGTFFLWEGRPWWGWRTPDGMVLTVQPYDLGKLPVSAASEPQRQGWPGL